MSGADGVVESPKALAAALVKAQLAAKPVPKDSTNEKMRYAYASTEDVIESARTALNGAGLSLICTDSKVGGSAAGDGTVLVHNVYLLQHVSGESLTLVYDCPAVPHPGMPIDKAMAAARTYNLGYCLRDLLLLPRVEAGTDVDQRDDTAHASAPEPQARSAASSGQQRAPAPPAEGPGWVPSFGRGKGEKLEDQDGENLAWYAKALQESVEDPKKARFLATNRSALAAVRAEIARRDNEDAEGREYQADREQGGGDDDIPF
jgi:hypothetical protein